MDGNARSGARTMIDLRKVRKVFDGQQQPAVEQLDLEIFQGELVVLVGPSGCGKTTTMKMINRLVEPTSGSIHVDGQDVLQQDATTLRRGIGYVIQSIGLMPHRSVRENIAMVPRLCGWGESKISERVEELMEMFALDPSLEGRFPAELSGGQRQRVGVARALAVDPPAMLMDEPFGAVDPIVRERLQDQFLDIQRRLKKTIVFVTHDVDEALKMADRIAILNIGGVLEQYATPMEILSKPATPFVESFIGDERGLKRLALMSVGELLLDPGPVVRSGHRVEAGSASPYDWVVIVDNGRLAGWASRAEWESSPDGRVEPQPFSAVVTRSHTLREALDAIVTSRTNVAAVIDDAGTYMGLVNLEMLTGSLNL